MTVPAGNLISREIKWLVTQYRPHIFLVLASLLFSGIGSLAALLDPLIIRWLVDHALAQRDLKLLAVASGAYLLAHVCRLAFTGMGNICGVKAAQKAAFRIRLSLLRHLQMLSLQFHDRTPVGDTLYTVGQDVDRVTELGGNLATDAVELLVFAIVIIPTMFVLDLRLALLVMPAIPAFLLIRWRHEPQLRARSEAVERHSAERGSFLQEHLSCISQIQLLCREICEARRFAHLSAVILRAEVKRASLELFLTLTSMLTITTGAVMILAYGGYRVIHGSMSVGSLIAFYGYLHHLFGLLWATLYIHLYFQRLRASIRRILAVMELEPAIVDSVGAVQLGNEKIGAVEFCNVSFSYEPKRPVLSGLNFRVNPGERVALVGKSGSGKTTVVRLITRLYAAQGGSVLVNGIDVRDIKLKSLRSRIVLVLQEPVIFHATFRENLSYGNPSADRTRLEEAAILTGLEEVVQKSPSGWNEVIGPRGSSLSAGQRQLVAVARAILQQPSILILDEATSALDADTEYKLIEKLDKTLLGTTVILISHRPFVAWWANRILVLDDGQIVEEGKHSALLELGGMYRSIYEKHSRHLFPLIRGRI